MELRPGIQIDRYVLESRLGEGGQGAVWRAEDRLQPGRMVALKLAPMGADGAQLERVRREARHLARLKHPGLPACHALFEDLQLGYLVVAMELVQGPTLAEAAVALDEPKKLAALRQIAATLAFLHGAGVVHRDLKPENVILCHEFWANSLLQGSVKLIDLGISVSSGNPQPLTVVGHLIGTPSFLSPEILDPHYFPALPGTPGADLFAFGVLGWWLLHGAHPTGLADGSSLASYALAYRQADQTPLWPPSSRSDRWIPLLRRCLAVRQRERFSSGADLLAALSAEDAGLSSVPGATRLEPVVDRPSALPATRLEPVPSFAPPAATPLPPPVPSSTPSFAATEPWGAPVPTTAPDLVPVPTTAPGGAPVPTTEPGGFVPTTEPGSPRASTLSPAAAHLSPMAPPAASPSRSAAPPAAAPATVFAAPLPASFPQQRPPPARVPATLPSGPAASAQPRPARDPFVPRERHLPVPSPAAAPAEKSSIFRYILAAILLFVGGGLAFVITIFLFILISLGR